MRFNPGMVMGAAISGLLVAGALAPVGANAAPYNSRDCKYYGICGPDSTSYVGHYDAARRPNRVPATEAAQPTVQDESGLNGPHGPGW